MKKRESLSKFGHEMKQFNNLLRKIIDTGVHRQDRTQTGTIACFGERMEFDISTKFPAITSKKLAWKAVVSELLWFIEGSGDERRLAEILHGTRDAEKTTIWTDNAKAEYWKPKAKFEGDLGRVYGQQWRKFPKPPKNFLQRLKQLFTGPEYVDQLAELLDGLVNDPYGRRHVLTAWNPGELDQMALPPCHMFAQFFVSDLTTEELREEIKIAYSTLSEKDKIVNAPILDMEPTASLAQKIGAKWGKISCQMYQRSADMFLGVPFNIASYSLFTYMIGQVTGLKPDKFIHVLGDAHIYKNHIEAVETLLAREEFELPTLWIDPTVDALDGFTMDSFRLDNYQCHEAIKAKMAV